MIEFGYENFSCGLDFMSKVEKVDALGLEMGYDRLMYCVRLVCEKQIQMKLIEKQWKRSISSLSESGAAIAQEAKDKVDEETKNVIVTVAAMVEEVEKLRSDILDEMEKSRSCRFFSEVSELGTKKKFVDTRCLKGSKYSTATVCYYIFDNKCPHEKKSGMMPDKRVVEMEKRWAKILGTGLF